MSKLAAVWTLAALVAVVAAPASAASLIATDADYIGDFSGDVWSSGDLPDTWERKPNDFREKLDWDGDEADDANMGVWIKGDAPGPGGAWQLVEEALVRLDAMGWTDYGICVYAEAPDLTGGEIQFDFSKPDADANSVGLMAFGFTGTGTGFLDRDFKANTLEDAGDNIDTLHSESLSLSGLSGSVVTDADIDFSAYQRVAVVINTKAAGVTIDNLEIIPEPTTLALLGTGAAWLLRRRRR